MNVHSMIMFFHILRSFWLPSFNAAVGGDAGSVGSAVGRRQESIERGGKNGGAAEAKTATANGKGAHTDDDTSARGGADKKPPAGKKSKASYAVCCTSSYSTRCTFGENLFSQSSHFFSSYLI